MRRKEFLQQHTVGEHTYGVPEVFSWGEKATLTIGKFCSISYGVQIFLGGEHRVDWISTYPFSEFFNEGRVIPGHPHTKGNVKIGNDVWLASGSKILSGVTIGDGAVIGAGSVIAKDIPPYAVAVGNPGRVIKYRFEAEIIDHLLDIRWWDWPIEEVLKNLPLLMSGNVEMFLGKYRK